MSLRRVLQTHTALAGDPPPQYKMASPPVQVKERDKPNTPRQLWTVTTYANNTPARRSLTNSPGEAKPGVPIGNKAPTAPTAGPRGRSVRTEAYQGRNARHIGDLRLRFPKASLKCSCARVPLSDEPDKFWRPVASYQQDGGGPKHRASTQDASAGGKRRREHTRNLGQSHAGAALLSTYRAVFVYV